MQVLKRGYAPWQPYQFTSKSNTHQHTKHVHTNRKLPTKKQPNPTHPHRQDKTPCLPRSCTTTPPCRHLQTASRIRKGRCQPAAILKSPGRTRTANVALMALLTAPLARNPRNPPKTSSVCTAETSVLCAALAFGSVWERAQVLGPTCPQSPSRVRVTVANSYWIPPSRADSVPLFCCGSLLRQNLTGTKSATASMT